MRKPLIGVTPLYDYNYNSWWIIPGYLDAVIAAGGAPVMLPFTDNEFRTIVSPMIMYVITERLSCHLEKERNHSLKTRRYYRQMEY